MSAQSIPKKMKQQSILNIMKSKKDEKNVGPERAGFILSDQLKTELKELVAKELCVMKEEYECMFVEVSKKFEEKDSEIQKLD